MINQAKAWLNRAPKPKPVDPPGVTVPAWLVRACKAASWGAYAVVMYFLLLYTFDIAGDRAAAMNITHAGPWDSLSILFWFPYVVGYFIIAVSIPYVAKIAIPTFVSLSWHTDLVPKIWSLFIAVAVSLVIIAGTFTVQGHTLMERDRDAVVAVAGVEQEAAVLASRIADVQHALDEMTGNESIYIRTAASMSPEAYDEFVEARRGDWQYDRLRAYRATSVEAQRLREQMRDLRDQQARQTVAAEVQGEVVTERTGWIVATMRWLEGARAILLSFVMDIVCLIMPLIALRLEQARSRQMGIEASGWAPEGMRLEDLRDQPSLTPEPMDAPREVVRDAETGEELERIRPREYWRKKRPKRGQPERIEIPPEVMPDEVGVTVDGGNRIAIGASGEDGVMLASDNQQPVEDGQDAEEGAEEVQDEDLSDAELEALAMDGAFGDDDSSGEQEADGQDHQRNEENEHGRGLVSAE